MRHDRPLASSATVSGARRDRVHVVAASFLALGFFVWALHAVRDLTFVPPDAANYGVIARNLLRREGYTESLVPYHAVAYASVRHLPENHGLLRPFELVPLFAAVGVRPLALRIPAFLYTALTGIVVFCWTRRAFGTGAAWLACALTLLSANLFAYSFFGTDDTGFAFFFTATLALLWLGLTEGRERWFLFAGVTSGLAVLEKGVGLMLPLVFIVPGLRVFEIGVRRAGRWLGLLFGPFLAAVCIYAVRNYLAHGGVDFQMTPINWIYRFEGREGVARLFAEPPSLAGILRLVGWRRRASTVASDVGMFAASVLRLRPLTHPDPLGVMMVPAFLPVLALCGIPLYARRAPAMTGLFVASIVGAVVFICGFWFFELRYFVMLIPLFAIWAAAVVAFAGRAGRLARWASVVGAAALIGLSGAGLVEMEGVLPALSVLNPCPRALAWIVADVGPAERILAFDPWFVAWAADREAILIPSGGVEAIARVARRYDAHWLLAHRASSRPRTSDTVMAMAQEADADGLRVATRYDDGACRVYRLDWKRPEQ